MLLIEHGGPWPAEAVDQVVPQVLTTAQRETLARLPGLRVLLIRRARTATGPGGTVMVGGCRPGDRWLERVDPAALGDLDLTAVAFGSGGIGEPVDRPALLVCTNGRRDACCAVHGRPVAAELADHYPEETWECTHLGGHRFAGNLLVLPHGLLFGRLDARGALPVVAEALGGRVPVEELRGRTGLDAFAQVAEVEVRRRTGYAGLDAVLTGESSVEGEHATVTVRTPEGPFLVTLRRRRLDGRGISRCAGELAPTTVDVVAVRAPAPAS